MRIHSNQLSVVAAALPLTVLNGFTSVAVAADNIYVTAESPGVQQSSLYLNPSAYGATNVIQDNFNYLAPGYYSNGVPFDGSSAIGNYSTVGIQLANQYGGAGGRGNYFTVAAPFSSTSSTLSFTTPQRYFGFWLSALDRNNQLSFYSGSALLSSFSAQDVLNFINRQPDAQKYLGNPNSNFLGQDGPEPFAYLNFFASPENPTVTFDRIVFSNSKTTGTGFEADNFTIATSYSSTSGKAVAVPFEPSPTGGAVALIVGYVAHSLRFKRRQIKNQMSKTDTD